MADISASRSRMRSTVSLVVLALALVLGACTAPPERPDPLHASATAPLDALLASLHEFIAATPERRSEIYVDAVSALAQAPTAGRRLRLALLQGWPDHANSSPANALRLADQVLADESLPADVRDLARVLRFWIASHQVDQRRQTDLRRRIADLEARIEALQQQLQALTDIERDVEPRP